MAPEIHTGRIELAYPIYASDFDSSNHDFLFVGGGGGESRSGVKNKITLIDTSKRRELAEIVDVELSSSEDSVQNLVVAQSQDDSAVVFAGINSSQADQQKGVNEHLRSFKLRYPAKRRKEKDSKTEDHQDQSNTGSTIQALSKAALFRPTTSVKKEMYQRLMRLTADVSGSTRLGVVASCFAPENEIVVFNATNPRPDKRDIRTRIVLANGKEAEDVDVIVPRESEYLVVHCCDHEIFLTKVTEDKESAVKAPISIYKTPVAAGKSTSRLKVRFVRLLNPRLMLAVLNVPKFGGSEMFLMELDSEGNVATVLLRKTLHRGIKAATTLAVATLNPAKVKHTVQHVIAIGGQDVSLTILTLDYTHESRNVSFKQHSMHKDLHPMQMTSLAFSKFTPPADPLTATPQYLKLASTSMKNTVVVQTLPLSPYPPPVAKRQPNDPPVRYTLISPKPEKIATPLGLSAIIAIILVALSAILLQAFAESRNLIPKSANGKGWIPESIRTKIALPHIFRNGPVLTDSSLPPIQPGAQKAYDAVKEAVTTREKDMRDAVRNTVKGAKEAAESVQETIIDHHGKIRDMLANRAEHIATRLSSEEEEDDDDEDDDDAPLFGNGYESGERVNTEPRPIVFRDLSTDDDHAISTEHHHTEGDLLREGTARKWEDLHEHEREGWLQKLEEAGIWAANEGETVFKGIFFSELGGLVGAALRG